MEVPNTQYVTTQNSNDNVSTTGPNLSAVSWAAVFAGATTSASLSLIFLILGTGLGLSSVSPWANSGISATAFGISTILWITITTVIAYALGGYVAGRLRTRWLSTDVDEVHFRDTAHGFLAWAVATLASAVLLTSAISAIVGGTAQAGAAFAGAGLTNAKTMMNNGSMMNNGEGRNNNANDHSTLGMGDRSFNYAMDMLFRAERSSYPEAGTDNQPSVDAQPSGAATDMSSQPSNDSGTNIGANGANTSTGANTGTGANTVTGANTSTGAKANQNINRGRVGNGAAAPRMEIARIYMNALSRDKLPDDDVRYAGQIVARSTGLSQANAERRVVDTFNSLHAKMQDVKTAADQVRKASAYGALWMFISLLMGAFAASLMAVYGGRQRDL